MIDGCAQTEATASVRRAAAGKRLLVLDYDGTLAHLAVDWAGVRKGLTHVARDHGFESTFRPLWREIGRYRDTVGASSLPVLFEELARHEARGVAGQRPRWDIVAAVREVAAELQLESAILSLNLHRTVEAGLALMGVQSISAIVGADDVRHWKPDPEGLNALLAGFGTAPGDALFLGDSSNDAEAARSAGVAFLRV